MKAIYIIIAIALVLLIFQISKALSYRKRITHKYIAILSALEFSLWIIILIWTLDYFLSYKQYYPYLIVIVVGTLTLLLVWFYFKDIVAGYLFKMRHNPIIGQNLNSEKHKGSIRKIGISQLTIETVNGELLRIPFSMLVTVPLSLQEPHSLAAGETVVKLKINALDPGFIERKIKETLALSSWCIASKPIHIMLDPDHDNHLRVSFYLIDPSYIALAHEKLNLVVKEISRIETSSNQLNL